MQTQQSTRSASSARNIRRRMLAVTAVVVSALVLTGCLNEHGQRSFDLMNAERRANRMHELVNDADLNARAQQWADHLAATGRLAHSTMTIPPGATRVAENVGYSGSVGDVHARLMASAPHRANILDARMTRVGIGATVDPQGRVWIVQLFAN